MSRHFFFSGIIFFTLWLLSGCSHSQSTDYHSPIVPVAVIVCEAPHFSAKAVEEQITLPLESALSRINVTNMYSESSAERSVITLYATKLSDEDRLALPSLLRTGQLPDGIVPQVYLPSSSRSSLHYILKSSTLNNKTLSDWHQKEFASLLRMQPGVEEVYTLGNIRRTVKVLPKLREMNARRIALTDLAAALDEVVLHGVIPPIDELSTIRVKNVNGISYLLSEVATVSTQHLPHPVSAWENGIRVQSGVVFFSGAPTAAEMEEKLQTLLHDTDSDVEILSFYAETKSPSNSPATLTLTVRVRASSSQSDREKQILAVNDILQADRSVAKVVVENGFSPFFQAEELHRLRAIIELKEGVSADSVKATLTRNLSISHFSDFYIQTNNSPNQPTSHTLYVVSPDREEAIQTGLELASKLAGEKAVSWIYTSGVTYTLTRDYELHPQNVAAYGLRISQATELLTLATEGKTWKNSNLELLPLTQEKIDFLEGIHFFLPEQVIPLNNLTLLSLKKGPSVLLRYNRQSAVCIAFETSDPGSILERLNDVDFSLLPKGCKLIVAPFSN